MFEPTLQSASLWGALICTSLLVVTCASSSTFRGPNQNGTTICVLEEIPTSLPPDSLYRLDSSGCSGAIPALGPCVAALGDCQNEDSQNCTSLGVACTKQFVACADDAILRWSPRVDGEEDHLPRPQDDCPSALSLRIQLLHFLLGGEYEGSWAQRSCAEAVCVGLRKCVGAQSNITFEFFTADACTPPVWPTITRSATETPTSAAVTRSASPTTVPHSVTGGDWTKSVLPSQTLMTTMMGRSTVSSPTATVSVTAESPPCPSITVSLTEPRRTPPTPSLTVQPSPSELPPHTTPCALSFPSFLGAIGAGETLHVSGTGSSECSGWRFVWQWAGGLPSKSQAIIVNKVISIVASTTNLPPGNATLRVTAFLPCVGDGEGAESNDGTCASNVSKDIGVAVVERIEVSWIVPVTPSLIAVAQGGSAFVELVASDDVEHVAWECVPAPCPAHTTRFADRDAVLVGVGNGATELPLHFTIRATGLTRHGQLVTRPVTVHVQVIEQGAAALSPCMVLHVNPPAIASLSARFIFLPAATDAGNSEEDGLLVEWSVSVGDGGDPPSSQTSLPLRSAFDTPTPPSAAAFRVSASLRSASGAVRICEASSSISVLPFAGPLPSPSTTCIASSFPEAGAIAVEVDHASSGWPMPLWLGATTALEATSGDSTIAAPWLLASNMKQLRLTTLAPFGMSTHHEGELPVNLTVTLRVFGTPIAKANCVVAIKALTMPMSLIAQLVASTAIPGSAAGDADAPLFAPANILVRLALGSGNSTLAELAIRRVASAVVLYGVPRQRADAQAAIDLWASTLGPSSPWQQLCGACGDAFRAALGISGAVAPSHAASTLWAVLQRPHGHASNVGTALALELLRNASRSLIGGMQIGALAQFGSSGGSGVAGAAVRQVAGSTSRVELRVNDTVTVDLSMPPTHGQSGSLGAVAIVIRQRADDADGASIVALPPLVTPPPHELALASPSIVVVQLHSRNVHTDAVARANQHGGHQSGHIAVRFGELRLTGVGPEHELACRRWEPHGPDGGFWSSVGVTTSVVRVGSNGTAAVACVTERGIPAGDQLLVSVFSAGPGVPGPTRKVEPPPDSTRTVRGAGAIVGITIGAAVPIAAIVVAAVVVRRRSKRKYHFTGTYGMFEPDLMPDVEMETGRTGVAEGSHPRGDSDGRHTPLGRGGGQASGMRRQGGVERRDVGFDLDML